MMDRKNFQLLVVLYASFAVHDNSVFAQPKVGDCVCSEGYVMDEFCIDRGTLLDKSSQETLVAPGPEVHSLHCLVDVAPCYNSGFTILVDNNDSTYSVGYRLDDDGDMKMKTFAEQSGAAGACDVCDGAMGGTVRNGFRATVIGRIQELGDSTSDRELDKATTLLVADILDSSVGCANFDPSSCPPVEVDDELPSVLDGPTTLVLSEDPRVVVEYKVSTSETSADKLLDVRMEYEGEGWIAFGISELGTMFGSEVIIGAPPGVPKKYSLSGYSVDAVELMPDEKQTLLNPTCSQSNGVTTMEFSKLLAEEDELEYSLKSENNFLWAVGLSNMLNYHLLRGHVSASITTGEDEKSKIDIVEDAVEVVEDTAEAAVKDIVDTSSTSLDGLTTIVLSEDPRLVVEYKVVTPETSADLSAAAIAAGGLLDVRMLYEGEGWLGFGQSPNGKMQDGEVVIALPPEMPRKYDLSGYATSFVVPMSEEKQTLEYSEVTQKDGVTEMRFGKLLNEGGIAAVIGEENNFIWAYGNDNELSYHGKRGSFVASLEACSGSNCVTVSSLVPSNKGLWAAHGILAVLGWGVLAPVAIASSLLRSFISIQGLWFKIHFYLNLLCVIFTMVFFILAVSATGLGGRPHFAGTHQKIGLTIFLISLFQVIGGVLRPHPPAPHDVADALTPDTNGDAGEEGVPSKKEDDKEAHKKTSARLAFEIGHRIFGSLLIALSFYNIDAGLKLFALIYGTSNWFTTGFWTWIGVFLVTVFGLTMYSRTTSKK